MFWHIKILPDSLIISIGQNAGSVLTSKAVSTFKALMCVCVCVCSLVANSL